MGEAAHETDLATLIARLAGQLRAADRLAQEVEEAIGELIGQSGARSGPPAASLQKLDVLAQSLESLATYVEALAEAVPPGIRADPRKAVKRVKLRALSRALAALEMPEHQSHSVADEGGLHLF